MSPLLALAVSLAVLQVAFSAFSFDEQINGKLPPDLTYPYSKPVVDGNPYSILVGKSGNSGTQNGLASASSTTITAPQFIWSDYNGVYFTDSQNNLIRAVDASGNVLTFAGTGTPGFNGDNKAATSTTFSRPRGVSGDKTRLIVCDTVNSRIRAITLGTTNTVTTIAGNGNHGYSGDGGQATSAELWSPYAVWVNEANGDIYFTELHKCTIRKVSGISGVITTIAGVVGTCAYNGDGSATITHLKLPRAIFGDAAANIFFVEFGSNIVRKLSAGVVKTIAGGVSNDPKNLINSGDGLLATDAALNRPTGVWVDKNGNVYIVDTYSAVVRKVSAKDGTISTVLGVQGARGPFTKVTVNNVLFHPRGIWGDDRTTFKLYLPDSDNHRIVTTDLPIALIKSVAGTGNSGNNGNGGAATSAKIRSPNDVWKDTNGNLFISDSTSHSIRKVDSNSIISNFAGIGSAGNTIVEGSAATSTAFNTTWGIWGDSSYLYVADTYNYRVRRISWIGNNPVTTYAGGGTSGGTAVDATTAALSGPSFIWGDTNGNRYISDRIDCTIRQVNSNNKIWIVAGMKDKCGYNGDGAPAVSFKLDNPRGLTGDNNGNLYIANYGGNKNSRIVKLNLDSGYISTIIGNANIATSDDGVVASSSVSINLPNAVWLDAYKNIYFSESGSDKIRVIYSSTGLLGTIAGNGNEGFVGDGIQAADPTVELDNPYGMYGDTNNNLYIADRGNRRVRVITYYNGATSRRLLEISQGMEEQSFISDERVIMPKLNLRRD